jgi:hypothetical protein
MTVAGRVRGPDGGAVAGARVVVLTSHYRRAGEPMLAQYRTEVLGTGKADKDGLFRLSVPQTTVGQHYAVTLLAAAPGDAVAAAPLDRLASTQDVPIRLETAQSIRGRLLGPTGEPAAGVRVHVTGMERKIGDGLSVHFQKPPPPMPAWPEPAVTDKEGRFVLHGLGPNLQVDVEVHDERFATQRLTLRTDAQQRTGEATRRLAPARVLEGRITAADSGRPLAGALVVAHREGLGGGTGINFVDGRADADGRYRIRPFLGNDLSIRVYPPVGSPYLLTSKRFRWPGKAARHEVSLALKRGVLVRGTVTEEGSGRAVAGASVEQVPRWTGSDDGPGPDRIDRSVSRWPWDARTGADGSFALAVFPGPSHLLVKGPTPDYLHVETTRNLLEFGRAGGQHYFPDALLPLSPRPGAAEQRVSITLRRGVTVRGRVLGHDGKPVASGLLLTPTHIPRGWTASGDPLPIRAGRFELPGCDPTGSVPAWFYEPAGRQGSWGRIAGNTKGEPVIRLSPCRDGLARVVRPGGPPLARQHALLELVLRPGKGDDRLTVPARLLYGRGFGTFTGDNRGITLPWLIPGAPYVLRAQRPSGWAYSDDFTVPGGQGMAHLGDVPVAPPPRKR